MFALEDSNELRPIYIFHDNLFYLNQMIISYLHSDTETTV